jgi:hypothetical protein
MSFAEQEFQRSRTSPQKQAGTNVIVPIWPRPAAMRKTDLRMTGPEPQYPPIVKRITVIRVMVMKT